MESDRRLPAEYRARLGRVADQLVDLGGTAQLRILAHEVMPIEAGARERQLGKLADAVRFAGGDDVITRFGLLQHAPHRVDVVAGESPVALRVEVAEREITGEA